MHQRVVPVLIQKIHKRDIAYHQNLHDDEFLSRLKDHVIKLAVDHPHITELADDGGQGSLEAAVMLASDEGIAPLGIYSVVNPVFQVMECCRHIGVNQPDTGHKSLEHRQHRRVQVWKIFLHRRQDVLVSEVCCGDDTERRFQLRRDVPFEVACRELYPPEGQEHTARRHHGNKEKVR
ncbi:hypothetical protein SDC9_184018 [bioreactor metagenome]|uniref:Uncharacterized protein n=1 Tax=bioreactor metagenome TaxID=1076179 RepID=A0A645HEF3_9ZZZZ